jgi:signal transduction histidine kinase
VIFSFDKGNASLITSDWELIQLILYQLLENSIIYGAPANPRTTLKFSVGINKELLITVTDNGVGILPDQIDRIFDMFHRASELSKGSGLGLYLVKKAVEKLGGRVNVLSSMDPLAPGTTFTVELPLLTVESQSLSLSSKKL